MLVKGVARQTKSSQYALVQCNTNVTEKILF